MLSLDQYKPLMCWSCPVIIHCQFRETAFTTEKKDDVTLYIERLLCIPPFKWSADNSTQQLAVSTAAAALPGFEPLMPLSDMT